MKKLLIIDPADSFGGAEQYALTIGKAAITAGWAVEAAFNTETMRLFGEELSKLGSVVHHAQLEMRDSMLRSIPAHMMMALRMFELLKKVRPDVALVVLPWPGYGLGVVCALAALSIPSLIVFQLVPAKRMKYRWVVNWLYRRSQIRKQVWVVVSEGNKGILSESFQVPRSEIEVIHNGVAVSNAAFAQANAREEKRIDLLSELSLNDETKLILSVGRLEERKGFLDILEAAPSIIRKVPQAHFIWAGEGNLRTDIEKSISKADLGKNISLLGHRTDVPNLLVACDMFLFPSHFEGFPFALLEAMVHQIPYVASDSCGSEEIGVDGEYGLHFKSGSAAEMADKVVLALLHPEEGVQRAVKARVRVQAFSIDEMTAKTLRIVDRICN